jgi:hypothetical protein
VVAAIAALSLFDWWLDRDGVDGNTYSERFRWLGRAWPPARLIVSFAFGVLAAHWWRW